MKNVSYNINQYLLERFPTVWNTKAVWVLGVSAILHCIFFLFGSVALTNPVLLHEIGAKHIFFDNGTVFLSTILSILILVVWLIHMFKNNAFKNFYPVSRANLFLQFIIYLMIVFCSTTFYYSYNFGLKTYISNTYDDSILTEEITQTNEAALFFSHSIENYKINRRKVPLILNDLFCETRDGFTDINKPHFEFLNMKYQFYSLYTKEKRLDETYNHHNFNGFVFSTRTDSIQIYYYRDTVVDVSKYIKSAYPSYYNYSNIFYVSKKNSSTDFYTNGYNNGLEIEYYYDHYEDAALRKISIETNTSVHRLLNTNNPSEIKEILNRFLSIANKYTINHNISLDEWFELVYHPNDFELKYLIRNERKKSSRIAMEEESALETFNNDHTTDFYIETQNLHHCFQNIEEIKNAPIFGESLHLFLWLSYLLSMVIFMFRITGLKALLLTVISVGVLSVFIALLSSLFSYAFKSLHYDFVMFSILYFLLVLGLIILLVPIIFESKLKKLMVAICLNISMVGFVFYLLLIIGIISLHQEHACRDHIDYNAGYQDCFILITSIDLYLSYLLFAVGLVFMYFYTATIKKWKALAEG